MRPTVVALLALALVGWTPGPASAAGATVRVTDFAFTPANVTIPAGDAVDWSFDEGTHSVVFDAQDGAPEDCSTSCSRAFEAAGTFRYRCGLHASMRGAVVVQAATTNEPPVAAFTLGVDGMRVLVNGSGSSDPGGSIVAYAWEWGDGASGSGAEANHTYAQNGTYSVKLTVRDDAGAVTSVARDVALGERALPDAGFTVEALGLLVRVNATGELASYAWDFGDGGKASGPVMEHLYPMAGAYTIRLAVSDSTGAKANASQRVALTFFDTTIDGLVARFDASNVTGAETAFFSWDFGDGETRDGRRVAHPYSRSGTFDVTLKLRSGDLETALSRPVTVVAPANASAPAPIAADEAPAESAADVPLGLPPLLAALAAAALIARRR